MLSFNVLIFPENSVFTSSILGPVVQSIVSLTSLLVVKMLIVLVSTISNLQVFLLKKMGVAFANAKAPHFSGKKLVYMQYLMIKVLTLTNGIISFEQLSPERYG